MFAFLLIVSSSNLLANIAHGASRSFQNKSNYYKMYDVGRSYDIFVPKENAAEFLRVFSNKTERVMTSKTKESIMAAPEPDLSYSQTTRTRIMAF